MAISYIGTSAAAHSNVTTLAPTRHASTQAGDLEILFVMGKAYDMTVGAPGPESWTAIGSVIADGTDAAGVDVGSMRISAYYRISAGETTAASIALSGTNNIGQARIMCFRAGSGSFETPVAVGGADTSAGTAFSATGASDPGITAADMLVAMMALRSDAGGPGTTGAISATGLTMGTKTDISVTTTTTGGDMGSAGVVYPITSGTSSAAPVYTATLGGSHPGVMDIVRIREASGATNLVIQDAAHAHAADNLALTQESTLVISDGAHAHQADNLSLTQEHVLTVADSSHAHSADNVVLEVAGEATLAIQDSAHAHSADQLTLTQVHELQVQDGSHAHQADGLALTQAHALAIADALHAHQADNLELTLESQDSAPAQVIHLPERIELGYEHEISIEGKGLDAPLVEGFSCTESVEAGGYEACSGEISEDTFIASRALYRYGATWRVIDKETGDTVFTGKLLDPEPSGDGKVQLAARGLGDLANKQVERLMYQSQNMDSWTAADSDPHNYKNFEKHGEVRGDAFTVEAGSTTLVGTDNKDRRLETPAKDDATGTRIAFQMTGLEDGDNYILQLYGRMKSGGAWCKIKAWIERKIDKPIRKKIDFTDDDHIGRLEWRAAGTNDTIKIRFIDKKAGQVDSLPIIHAMRWGSTKQVTSGKITAEVRGKTIVFSVKKGTSFKGGETTGLISWAPDQKLRAFRATVDRESKSSFYKLVLFGAEGPGGELKKIAEWNMSRDNLDGALSATFAANKKYDQLMIAMVRRGDKAGTKKAEPFSVELTEVRVNAIFKGDDFTVSDIARDICSRLDISAKRVSGSSMRAGPSDFQDMSYADVLTEICLLEDYRWLIHDDGKKPVMDFGPWDKREWKLTDRHATPSLLPLERWDRCRAPYRADGGTEHFTTVTLDRHIFPEGVHNTFELSIDDPIPNKKVVRQFCAKVLDYLSTRRAGGSAHFAFVENRGGTRVTASKMHAGDVLIVPSGNKLFGDRRLRIATLTRNENGTVDVEFDDRHAMLDKWLARRRRRLAMGRPNAQATIPQRSNE